MSTITVLKDYKVATGMYVWRGECIVQTGSKRWEVQRADGTIITKSSLTAAAAWVDSVSGVK